ncbi:hypothetical protein KIL84_014644 [Mauremys mutica]|uniref:Uncharacterized protein n=1 Tax=Mauremys mutica TaxID=74926 RepID=A0A9D3XRG3_9SAUR|nr:hypothetical protein KIL84_014644 [Mauremys mutica]
MVAAVKNASSSRKKGNYISYANLAICSFDTTLSTTEYFTSAVDLLCSDLCKSEAVIHSAARNHVESRNLQDSSREWAFRHRLGRKETQQEVVLPILPSPGQLARCRRMQGEPITSSGKKPWAAVKKNNKQERKRQWLLLRL